ncbi:hypothetical protein ACFVRB_41530 [Streptomyces nojiriensis]|uniref:hypothetical protein n=1 Tax=Streptomyces nojiriensis TaxID=66374 RepID=UPI0036DD0507
MAGQTTDVGFVEWGCGAKVCDRDPQGAHAGMVAGLAPATSADVVDEAVHEANGGRGKGGHRPGEEAGPIPLHLEQHRLARDREVLGDGPFRSGGADQPTSVGLQASPAVDPSHPAVAIDACLQTRGISAAEPELVGAVEGDVIEVVLGLGKQEHAPAAVAIAYRQEACAAVAGADRVRAAPVQAAGAPLVLVVRPSQAVGAAARRL